MHRGNLLDDRVKSWSRRAASTRAALAKAMADAALADLRAEDVLPDLLKVSTARTVTDSTAAAAVHQAADLA